MTCAMRDVCCSRSLILACRSSLDASTVDWMQSSNKIKSQLVLYPQLSSVLVVLKTDVLVLILAFEDCKYSSYWTVCQHSFIMVNNRKIIFVYLKSTKSTVFCQIKPKLPLTASVVSLQQKSCTSIKFYTSINITLNFRENCQKNSQ